VIHDPTSYGRDLAADYDELHDGVLDTDGAVEALTELARGGPVLEWGIGTGRLALPLVERGLRVAGVDTSPDMLEQLRGKPGGSTITVTLGDFTTTLVEGRFCLVVLAFNTLFALPDQGAQVECFRNAARHLAPGGRFVVEAFVPPLERFSNHRAEYPRPLGGGATATVTAEVDPIEQRMGTQQRTTIGGREMVVPMNHRYAWPAEMDLMARIAGLTLEHRWSGWRGAPVTADSDNLVSVYLNEG
jgi:SAM-dependent methyltransferase